MLHENAVFAPRQLLRLASPVVEERWPKRRAAEFFRVSWRTADRWAERYRVAGRAGMADRSSRPHRSSGKTGPQTTKRIASLRLRRR
ncbi:leucine zipper domain-containing protein [Blastococcus sp. SYSU D00813]